MGKVADAPSLVPPIAPSRVPEEVKGAYDKNIMNTYGRYPMTIAKGKGCKLYDTEGKEYLDFASGIATCCLGHSHPALKKAISNQVRSAFTPASSSNSSSMTEFI